jgi:hypothetical protein
MRTHLEGMTIHYEHLSAYRPLAQAGLRQRRRNAPELPVSSNNSQHASAK